MHVYTREKLTKTPLILDTLYFMGPFQPDFGSFCSHVSWSMCVVLSNEKLRYIEVREDIMTHMSASFVVHVGY